VLKKTATVRSLDRRQHGRRRPGARSRIRGEPFWT